MFSRWMVMFSFALVFAGCKKESTARPTGGTTAPSGGNTTVVHAGSPGEWKGDATACAAVKSCCGVSSDTTLMCALTSSQVQGDCAKGLPKIRQYIKEAKKTPPPGCM